MRSVLIFKKLVFRRAPSLAVWLIGLMSREVKLEQAFLRAVVTRGELALDIGASWGVCAFALQSSTDKVIAFEPNPEKATYLRSVFPKCEVHSIGLSDRSGDADLIIPHSSSALATIEAAHPLAASQSTESMHVKVPIRRLDDFCLDNVGFIKVDVEGHELAVLQGARDLLRRDHPVLFIEIEHRHNSAGFQKVFDLLKDLQYRAFYWDGQKIVDTRHFDLGRDQPVERSPGARLGGRSINNFLFVRETRAVTLLRILKKAGFEVVH